jgi:hypothetical protein
MAVSSAIGLDQGNSFTLSEIKRNLTSRTRSVSDSNSFSASITWRHSFEYAVQGRVLPFRKVEHDLRKLALENSDQT